MRLVTVSVRPRINNQPKRFEIKILAKWLKTTKILERLPVELSVIQPSAT